MNELIDHMNAHLAVSAADSEDINNDDTPAPIVGHAIQGIDCQSYNTVIHWVRGTADTRDTQRGDITAAFAGSYSQGLSQNCDTLAGHMQHLFTPHQLQPTH